MKNNREKEMAK